MSDYRVPADPQVGDWVVCLEPGSPWHEAVGRLARDWGHGVHASQYAVAVGRYIRGAGWVARQDAAWASRIPSQFWGQVCFWTDDVRPATPAEIAAARLDQESGL